MSATRLRVFITEKGESVVELTLAQAMELQEMRFCRVSPTTQPGLWRVSDVTRVGTAVVGETVLHVVPKTPMQNLVYMASAGHRHVTVGQHLVDHDEERTFPAALGRAFLTEVQRATRRGLVKGYEETHESASVMRGRWDVSRQLAVRPGLPLPLEIDYDHFSEDVPANRILHTAIRALRMVELPRGVESVRTQLEMDFFETGLVPRGMPLPIVEITRLNEHLDTALMLARLILDAVSWTHREGARRGGTFLLNMATVFESFVAERLRALLEPEGLRVTPQDRRWWLDVERVVALRPDMVVEADMPISVADTKYKVFTDGSGGPPSGDVYQMVAYALALDVRRAHLIYVSGDVVSQVIHIPSAGVDVHVHAVSLAGSIDDLEAEMTRLARTVSSRS